MITASAHCNIFQTTVVLLSLFSIGLAIKCFQCNSAEHPGCGDLKVNDTNSQYYRECSDDYKGQAPFCRKVFTEVMDVEGSSRIARSCGWLQYKKSTNKDMCRKADTDFLRKRHCECFTDACNTSERISSSLTLVVVIATVCHVFTKLSVI